METTGPMWSSPLTRYAGRPKGTLFRKEAKPRNVVDCSGELTNMALVR